MHAGNIPPHAAALSGWRDCPNAVPLLDRVRHAFHPVNWDTAMAAALTAPDRIYATGATRLEALLLPAYFQQRPQAVQDMARWYAHHCAFRQLDPGEANSTETSWQTVLAGLRPMGQFSVPTLFSPVLHAMLELDRIGAFIFPGEGSDTLLIVVIYRRDAEQGEAFARRFIELYRQKQDLMRTMDGSAADRAIASEKIVARPMGEILHYTDASIDAYLKHLDTLGQPPPQGTSTG